MRYSGIASGEAASWLPRKSTSKEYSLTRYARRKREVLVEGLDGVSEVASGVAVVVVQRTLREESTHEGAHAIDDELIG